MSSYDPRIIALALEDLLQEMALWSAKASETLRAATYAQKQGRESAERAMHQAAILMDQARQDEERTNEILSETAAIRDHCVTARSDSNQALEQSEQALEDATATLEYWEEELSKALAWLQRAEARLARAINEYERALRAFENSERELHRAEARYQACLNDSQRRNCHREAEAVNYARVELQRAAQLVEAAKEEVIAARIEVEAARARVECCSKAVEHAAQAVALGREAVSQANQAVSAAERSLEFAQAAERSAITAKEKVTAEIEMAEQMLSITRNVVLLTDEAAANLITADRMEEAAQKYAKGATHELEHRVQVLYEINRPDLSASV